MKQIIIVITLFIITIKSQETIKTETNEAETLKCSQHTLCAACTEVQGNAFRPVARGCVWCDQSFNSYCTHPSQNTCNVGHTRTFGNCGFSWVPVVIIFIVFGFLFFAYGTFIMIIKQCEYSRYQKIIQKNDSHVAIQLDDNNNATNNVE